MSVMGMSLRGVNTPGIAERYIYHKELSCRKGITTKVRDQGSGR